MKTSFLFAVILGLAGSALLADETVKPDPLEVRLKAIEDQLAKIENLLRAPTPVIVVPDATPGHIRVTILGRVNAPGTYIVDGNTSMGALVGFAKGFANYANTKNVSIVHEDGTTVKVDASADPLGYKMKGNDIVTVPERYNQY